MFIEYVLCYAESFTLGAAFGGAVIWYLHYLKSQGKI
jgi:hypothetical protein